MAGEHVGRDILRGDGPLGHRERGRTIRTTGVLIAGFFTEWKSSIYKGSSAKFLGQPKPPAKGEPAVYRFYTNRDCGTVYDLLRYKYPDLEEDWLRVRMIPETELRTPVDQRHLAARKIDTSRFICEEGEHPLSEIIWKGERPHIPYTPGSGPLELIKGGAEDFPTDQAAMVMSVFGEERHEWIPAELPFQKGERQDDAR